MVSWWIYNSGSNRVDGGAAKGMAPIWLSAMYRSTTKICEAISFSYLLCETYRDPYV